MSAGRPSDYSKEIAAKICDIIAFSNKSLQSICEPDDMPCDRTVFRWLASNAQFSQEYAKAKEAQADFLAEEMLEIADDGSHDYKIKLGEKGEYQGVTFDAEHVARSRLRVDTRKFLAMKLKPKKYGDALKVTGDPNAPLTIVISQADKSA